MQPYENSRVNSLHPLFKRISNYAQCNGYRDGPIADGMRKCQANYPLCKSRSTVQVNSTNPSTQKHNQHTFMASNGHQSTPTPPATSAIDWDAVGFKVHQ